MTKYRILKKLSEGGFGRVCLAEDTESGQLVAIKELHKLDADSRARFERELRLLQEQIDNRYVVDVLNFNFENNPPFIVMEYCDGGSLRGWVNARQPWRTVALALGHIAEGLAGIHKAGGFHRDIKPDNILLANSPGEGLIVKIADFGLARVPHGNASTITYTGAGTPGYIAPEIAMGADFHAGADIFSLGIVGLELLTGTTDIANLESASIPERLKQLVASMLHRKPVARPNIQRVAAELNSLCTATPLVPPAPSRQVAAPRPPAVARAPEQPSNGNGAAIAVLGFGALVLGGLAYLAINSPEWDATVQRNRGRDGRFRKS